MSPSTNTSGRPGTDGHSDQQLGARNAGGPVYVLGVLRRHEGWLPLARNCNFQARNRTGEPARPAPVCPPDQSIGRAFDASQMIGTAVQIGGYARSYWSTKVSKASLSARRGATGESPSLHTCPSGPATATHGHAAVSSGTTPSEWLGGQVIDAAGAGVVVAGVRALNDFVGALHLLRSPDAVDNASGDGRNRVHLP